MSSVTCVSGCNLPSTRRRPGSVKSVGSFGSAAFSSSSSRRDTSAASSSILAALINLPAAGFSSFESVPSCFISAVNLPFGPIHAPLVCSSAARSGAAFNSASAVCFSGSISSRNPAIKFEERLAAKNAKDTKNFGSRRRSPHRFNLVNSVIRLKTKRANLFRPPVCLISNLRFTLLPESRRACSSARSWRDSPIL